MVEDNLIEGTLKYRDGKKWKQRWAVLNKLSPVADVLQLKLYRDSRDKARGAPTKASLALTNTLALITGFTLDKESHTLALLCKDLSLILAYESRDRLLQWSSKLNITFGNEQQFLVQLVQVPLKSRVPLGPSRLHVRNHRFCLTAGTPPRLLAAWSSVDVRRYGVVDGRFVWEGGTRCGRGTGIHVLLSDTPHDITRALDLAAKGGLTSLARRSSSSTGNISIVQRDAATWFREIGALDLSKFSEAGDTTSLLTSEAGSILSPHGNSLSRNDLLSGHWPGERRPSCAAHDSYITAGSSSSSGSLTSEDPGWWSNTWTSARGSLWEVTPPSPVPEGLYDSPRSIIHQPSSFAAHSNSTIPNHHWCTQTLRHPRPLNPCQSGCQRLYVTPNPLDNYDVPKNHLLNYDTPRRFHTLHDKGTFCQSEVQSRSVDTCGKVLGWAGAFMCRRVDTSLEYVEPVRLSGEGRMPVLDANTGTLIHPKPPPCNSVLGSCSCSSPYSLKDGNCQEVPSTQRKITSSLSSSPIYAVVDKTKKISKPRVPTPPSSPCHPKLSESKSNYANLPCSQSSKELSQASKSCDSSDLCNHCGGIVTPDSSLNESELMVSSQPEKKTGKENEDADYLVMGPGSYSIQNSDYLCMESNVKSPTYPQKKPEVQRQAPYRPGRSLSLARRDRSPSPQRRRSSSADSRLHEPWETSQFNSPEPTPAATPMPSPPPSPFRTSTPQYETTGCGRGRTRKRISNREPRPTFSPSSIGSESLETPPPESVCQVSCPAHLPGGETPLILRRSSSVPVAKSANRDSASSSDSGVCESPRPSERILLSHCLHNSLPRGSRQKHGYHSNGHQNSGPTLGSCREIGPTHTVDAKSSSSGTSDISDYLDTLSMSSHSSSDHERLLGRASATTLRPRSGKEYSRLDRAALEASILPAVGEIPIQSRPDT